MSGFLHDEGYVKYRCEHTAAPLPVGDYEALLTLRNRLYAAGLIGCYPSGIGFGNVSQRTEPLASQFVITATQTGHLPTLSNPELCVVTDCQPHTNTVYCTGSLPASSEAMTHHSIYQALPHVNWVAHVHHEAVWQKHMHTLPTTPASVPYGTPEMCLAVATLLQEQPTGIFLTAGHAEGVFCYGATLQEVVGHLAQLQLL